MRIHLRAVSRLSAVALLATTAAAQSSRTIPPPPDVAARTARIPSRSAVAIASVSRS